MKFTSLAVAILSVSVVFIVLCSIAVALRIQARRTRSLPLKGDDYTILAALVGLQTLPQLSAYVDCLRSPMLLCVRAKSGAQSRTDLGNRCLL